MHTDYVDIPQPFTQDNCYTITRPIYGLPSSACAWFSTMSQFFQPQGDARLFGRLAAAFFTAGFRMAFIQALSVPEPFRQEHIIFRQEYIIWYNSICADFDTHAALVYMLRWRPYECNQTPAVPAHNAPPAEARDVVLAARAARHTSRDNRQARRLVSAANSASENDDDDGDDEATYVRMPFTLMPRRFTLMPRGLKMRRYMLQCKRPATRQHRRCTKFLTSASSKSFVIPFPTYTSLSKHFLLIFLPALQDLHDATWFNVRLQVYITCVLHC